MTAPRKKPLAKAAKPKPKAPSGAKLLVDEVCRMRDELVAGLRLERARVSALESRLAAALADIAICKDQIRSLQMSRSTEYLPPAAPSTRPTLTRPTEDLIAGCGR